MAEENTKVANVGSNRNAKIAGVVAATTGIILAFSTGVGTALVGALIAGFAAFIIARKFKLGERTAPMVDKAVDFTKKGAQFTKELAEKAFQTSKDMLAEGVDRLGNKISEKHWSGLKEKIKEKKDSMSEWVSGFKEDHPILTEGMKKSASYAKTAALYAGILTVGMALLGLTSGAGVVVYPLIAAAIFAGIGMMVGSAKALWSERNSEKDQPELQKGEGFVGRLKERREEMDPQQSM